MLKDLNAAGCLLVGDPAYYARFGFASPQGLSYEGVPQKNFMTLPFNDNAPDKKIPQGIVHFHPAFTATE